MDIEYGKSQAGEWWGHVKFNGFNLDSATHLEWLSNQTSHEDLWQASIERVVESGRSWDLSDTTLGRPLPVFQSIFSGPGRMEIRRPVLKREHYRLGMDLGDKVRTVREVTVIDRSASQYLFQDFPFDAFVGTWGQDDFVRLKVSKGSRFYFMYLGSEPGEQDESGAAGFRKLFDDLPDDRRTITLRKIMHNPHSEIWRWPSHFYIRRATDSDRWFWMYLAFEGSAPGLLPAARNAAPPESVFPGKDMPTFYVGPRSAAAGIAQNVLKTYEYSSGDEFSGWVQMLYPAGVLVCQSIDMPGNDQYDLYLGYDYAWSTPPLVQEAILSAPGKHPEPLVKLVDGVRGRTFMTVAPQDTEQPTWAFQGEQHGTLEPEGRNCWYCPPAAPVVEYVDSEKTLRGCVRKAPLFAPVSIDKVMTGTPSHPLYSTYVILNAQPTHYFRLEERGHLVGLQLCYTARGGAEVIVPSADIEWKVLAGAGSMAQDGTFKPGLGELFSVVLAVEKHDRYWYWAVIILPLPLKDSRGFISMSNATV